MAVAGQLSEQKAYSDESSLQTTGEEGESVGLDLAGAPSPALLQTKNGDSVDVDEASELDSTAKTGQKRARQLEPMEMEHSGTTCCEV